MTAVGRLAAVSIDCDDPGETSQFWRRMLDLAVIWESADFVALKGAGVLLTVQRVADYQAPAWPEGEIPKQMHLELSVDDLDEAERQAVELGARSAEVQPSPDRWRVLVDPAGHPFCVTIGVPDP